QFVFDGFDLRKSGEPMKILVASAVLPPVMSKGANHRQQDRRRCFVLALLLLSACSHKDEQPVAAAAPSVGEARQADGTVTIPPDSPKLKQIKLDVVRSQAVPFDVVTSPGKIEANPNLVSRVVLPLPGRIESVRVRLGDAVKRGDTLLTLESPDADAAES